MLILVLLEFLHGLIADLLELSLVLRINFSLDASPLTGGGYLLHSCIVGTLNYFNTWTNALSRRLRPLKCLSLWRGLLDSCFLSLDWCLINNGLGSRLPLIGKSLTYVRPVSWIAERCLP